METENLLKAEKNALAWLRYATNKVNFEGFAHSRRNWLPERFAWRASYPETSGYIIENLLNHNSLLASDHEIAIKTGDWLLKIQDPAGFFYGGINQKKASSFNTAQILFGLHALYQHTKASKYNDAIQLSKKWLFSQIQGDGKWTKGLYVIDYFPTYFSRAIWPLMLVSHKEEESAILLKSFDLLWKQRDLASIFKNAGFFPNKPVLSHTMVYSLEGFYEIALLINNENIVSEIIEILETEAKDINQKKSLWAQIDPTGKKNYNFRCITGEAQMASLFFKIFRQHKNPTLWDAGNILLQGLVEIQIRSENKYNNGAFPASIPLYSTYFPFQYVNWTNKFFLDACYFKKQTEVG
ncbi:MAG: hypothetical protein IPH93_08685 [Saprospiraceae bacterium]|nr:hypothetical protein [Saprospiraceae bacterium]MBK7810571.1 hypothetical protein [Saprospiraceae bacterium]MBK9630162.1 hypothetical protein [Saprospiraceae bacterium]